MIGKTVKGNGFAGVLAYVFEKPNATILGSNMGAASPQALAREFRSITRFNSRVKKPVAHISLSPTTQDEVSDQKALELIQQYLKRIGFDECQWIAIKHMDAFFEGKPRPHYHIVANRVRQSDKRVVTAWRDWRRSEAAIRELEQEFQLSEVAASWDYDKRQIGNGEWQKLKREQSEEVPLKIRLQQLIDHCAEGHPTMLEFIERLKKSEVKAKVHFQSTGRVQGLTYEMQGTVFSGTKLGKAYTFNGVQKWKGVSYESERDNPVLKDDEPLKTKPQQQATRNQLKPTKRSRSRELEL